MPSSRQGQKIHRVRVTQVGVGEGKFWGRMVPVIRGALPPDQLECLDVPEYQRRAMMYGDKHPELKEALSLEGIGIPDDLLLCSRSASFSSVGAGEVVIPTSALYVLDGHQRLEAALKRLKAEQPLDPVGVKIFLGTTEEEEPHVFYQVNGLQTPVSTDVFLRNSKTNPAIDALYKLAESESVNGFPTVRWDQGKLEGEQIRAHMLYEVAIILHGYSLGKGFEEILDALSEIDDEIGTKQLVENVKTFFKVLEECFGKKYPLLLYRVDFMRGLARLFGQYDDFWDTKNEDNLLVRATEKNRISTTKQKVIESDLATTAATANLSRSFVRHIDVVRKKNLLRLRKNTVKERRAKRG